MFCAWRIDDPTKFFRTIKKVQGVDGAEEAVGVEHPLRHVDQIPRLDRPIGIVALIIAFALDTVDHDPFRQVGALPHMSPGLDEHSATKHLQARQRRRGRVQPPQALRIVQPPATAVFV